MSLEVVGAAIRDTLRGDEPTSAREVVDAFGGTSAVARLIVGLPQRGKLPKAGTDPRRAYNSAIRRVQRWVTSAGEARSGGWRQLAPDVRAQLVEAAWSAQARRRAAELARDGARARLSGLIRVGSPTVAKPDDIRRRSMPSGGPGVMLGGDVVGHFSAAALEGDLADAGGIFLGAFLESYGGGLAGADLEVDEVDDVALWPEGQAEGSW